MLILKNIWGNTVLVCAIEEDHVEIIKLLIDFAAIK